MSCSLDYYKIKYCLKHIFLITRPFTKRMEINTISYIVLVLFISSFFDIKRMEL